MFHLMSFHQCLMMILFQRKLIYMGYIPLGAREEDVASYTSLLQDDIELEEIKLTNSRAILHGIIVRRTCRTKRPATIIYLQGTVKSILFICLKVLYVAGNAGNPLQRIPLFKSLLAACPDLDLRIVAVAPRSFWKSLPRRPNERGLLDDYAQVVQFVSTRWPHEPIFLLGHSLGASISVCLTSKMEDHPNICGLVLENAFSSIPDMVRALYPSRWLPYHYLAPFAWDKWDAVTAARDAREGSTFRRLARSGRLLVLQSELDEVVPSYMGDWLCRGAGVDGPTVIRDALHENAWIASSDWGKAIYFFLTRNMPACQHGTPLQPP